MTCKDCKISDKCQDRHKSFEYEKDGDSWANWCDDFQSVHKGKRVVVDGYTVMQSGENHHVMIVDAEGNMIMHSACTRELTEDELRGQLDLYRMLVKAVKRIEDEEGDV
jgi:hypothetical protein